MDRVERHVSENFRFDAESWRLSGTQAKAAGQGGKIIRRRRVSRLDMPKSLVKLTRNRNLQIDPYTGGKKTPTRKPRSTANAALL